MYNHAPSDYTCPFCCLVQNIDYAPTILELADKVLELTGSKSKIVYNPLPEDDPVKRQPDISLAKRELDWEPRIKLEEGLRRTIEYFKTIV